MKQIPIFFTLFILMATCILATVSSIDRSVPVQVSTNQQVNIDLTMTVTDKAGLIVYDEIPAGWTYVSGGRLIGDTVEVVLFKSSPGIVTESYILKAPSTANDEVIFVGTYQKSDKVTHDLINDITKVVQGPSAPAKSNPNIMWVALAAGIGLILFMKK